MGFLNNRHRPDLDNHGKELFYGYLHDDDLESALKIWEESTPLSRMAEFEACQSYMLLEMQECPKRINAIRERVEDLRKMIKLDKRSAHRVFKPDDEPEPEGDSGDGRA